MQTTDPFLALFGIGISAAEMEASQTAHQARNAAEQAKIAMLKAHDNAAASIRLRPHCNRCGGRGHISAFQHIKAGACFACN